MKLPFNYPGDDDGGGNGDDSYHNYSETSFDDDYDINSLDDIIIESPEPLTFEEYYWMIEEEEFDKREMERLEMEELMEECIQYMEGDDDDFAVPDHYHQWMIPIESVIFESRWSMHTIHDIENSTLNPLAKEFIPSAAREN